MDVTLWKPHPTMPGFSVVDRRKTVGEIVEELDALIPSEVRETSLEYGFVTSGLPREQPCPRHDRLIAYAVEGRNEGYFVFFDALFGDERQSIAMAKFCSWDGAWAVAGKVSRALLWNPPEESE